MYFPHTTVTGQEPTPHNIPEELRPLLAKFCTHILLSTTNKMQRYTIFFIIVNALHVSCGFSAHHQELKNCTHSIWYVPGLLAATAYGNSKQAWHIPDAVCTVLELLMKSRETARNM